jgi:YD repeat-containing protein
MIKKLMLLNMYSMKKIVFFFFILYFQISYSQIYDDSFDPKAEAHRLAKTPNSPEAQAFTKYGNTSVNMYTGSPNIQIPIYTHKGRELDLPISLTYDASGVKVDQLATQVGLGWNLKVGGRISRITNGFPDDFIRGSFTSIGYKSIFDSEVRNKINSYKNLGTNPSFRSKSELLNYMNFLRKASVNEYDTQPDYFSFNALGTSDTFVLNTSSSPTATALDDPNTKVEFKKTILQGADTPIEGWIVTTDDGTKYTFIEAEVTRDLNLSVDNGPQSWFGFKKEFNSSWLLTKIESATGKDVYEFSYTDLGFWSSDRSGGQITGVTSALKCQNEFGGSTPSPSIPMGYNGNIQYKVKQKVLDKIIHNGKRIVKIGLLDNRWDLDVDSAIQKIHIYNNDTNTHTEDLHQSFEFVYDYFRTDFAKEPPYNEYHKPNKLFVRLKLDEILIKGSTENFLKKYKFDYIDPYNLASTTANSKDYYGYNNGAQYGTVLYPKFTHPCVQQDGVSRDPNFSHAKKGLLNKITYPTGGYTEFSYQPNYEKKVVGESNVWTTVAEVNLSNDSSNLPFDRQACNAIFNGTINTPITNYDTFEVTQTKNHEIEWRRVFESFDNGHPRGDYTANHTFTLVKINNESSPVIWTDIFDENCNQQPNPNIEVVWTRDFSSNLNPPFLDPPLGGISFIVLEPGHYQLIIANPFNNVNFNLTARENNSITNYEYIEKAGVRVNSIKDFDSDASLATHKTYEYPSGTVISDPRYIYISNQYTFNQGQIEETEILHRLSFASGTEKPHIGYSEVIEKIVDGTSTLGSTTHSFYTDKAANYRAGIYSYYIGEYDKETAKHYGVEYKLGKPKSTTAYNTNEEKVSENHTAYQTKTYNNSLKSLYVHIEESKSHLYPIPTENPQTRLWYIRYIEPDRVNGMISPDLGGDGMIRITEPSECNLFNFNSSDNVTNLCTPAVARLSKQSTNAWGKIGNKFLNSTTQYFNNETKQVNQLTEYSYYDQIQYLPSPIPGKPDIEILPNYLLKNSSTRNSNDDSLRQEFDYPNSYYCPANDCGSLISNNILSTPIQTRIYKNNSLISSKKTIYSGILPSKIQTSKGDQPLEDRLLFERYKYGNLVQVKQVNGTSTAYLWGYEGKYVVAKLENATYAQIEQLSVFGSNTNLTSNLSDAQETALRNISNAMVTTFKYIPQIGVTSITDPRGRTVFYEYDEFNRLEFVKDQEGKILNENQYNYKN